MCGVGLPVMVRWYRLSLRTYWWMKPLLSCRYRGYRMSGHSTLDTAAVSCSLHAATLDYFRSFHVNTETLGTKLFNLFRHINLIVTLECFMTHLSFDPVYNFTIKPSQKPRCPGSGGLVGSVWLVSLIFLFITSACCPVIINCGWPGIFLTQKETTITNAI